MKFPRPRFSLRSLLLGVLMLASAATVWRNWQPWRLAFTIREPSGIGYVSFSDDCTTLLIPFAGDNADQNTLDVVDLKSGKRRALLADTRGPGSVSIRGGYAYFTVRGGGGQNPV